MKNFYLSLILIFLFSSVSIAQTTIYNEDFSAQGSKGAVGPLPVVNLSEVNWSIDITGANLNIQNRYIQVNDDYLESRALNTTAIWFSPIVEITGFTNVQFSLDAFSNATANLEDSDTFITEYRIDGGIWVVAANNGTLINDFPPTVVSDNGLTGNTIEIRVSMTNNGGGERHRLDNILIEGTAPVTSSIIVNPASINDFGYVEGETSLQEGTFTVQGFNLTSDILLTAPGNFEISNTSGGGFANTITLTPTVGVVGLTPIYTRLISGLTANSYNGTLIASSPTVTSENVDLNGEVTAPIANCSELIISEYHETNAGGIEKYIELYNPTGATVDLSNYRLANYRNDDGIPVSIDLTGTLEASSTYVIARLGSQLCATADLCTNSNVLTFSGNDAIALQTISGENIDIIGEISGNINFANNIVLRRNLDVAIPTITYDASQWSTTTPDDVSNFGVHVNNCECPDTTTWNGTTWDNGIPSSTTVAILDGNFDTSIGGLQVSFNACSLIVNGGSNLIVNNGTFIQIENDIVSDGNITVFPEGSVVQVNNASSTVANGAITVQKETTLLNSPLEYTYWSSPVVGETVENSFGLVPASRRFLFNAFNFEDLLEEINNTGNYIPGQDNIDDNGDSWQIASGIMSPGVGYATTAAPLGMFPVQQQFTFSGPFNNGIISTTIANNSGGVYNDWNFIGNPYPSAIDTNVFFAANAGSVDAIYLWNQATPADANASGNEGQNFSGADYAIISGSGVNTAGGDLSLIPADFVPSGQGFFVEALSGTPIIFNNSMRVTGNNNQFFRNANHNTSNRQVLWLNLTSDNGIAKQIAVAHIDGATDGYDGTLYDVKTNSFSASYAKFYSKITGTDDGYVIQGRNSSSLDFDEIIELGFETSIDVPTIFSLSIAQFEGDFYTTNNIYIKDNLLNIIHNIKDSDYSFTSEPGSFDNRFEVIFNSEILSVNDTTIDSNKLSIIELSDGNVQFKIDSQFIITKVEILDVLGRRIYDLIGNSSSEIYSLSKLNKAPYIAKVRLSNNQVIIKKTIKQK
ncbi:lamin tail domain-containing protein [Winogradskyella sp. PE311]|uniref:lamin tail domain-containing protein n=1 Tax=Winogradskyella sp. PE311 TaxID=3366943 RepID=UPI003980FB5C